MDLANTLIRTVVRTFYETRHILVVDALFIHSVYVLGSHGLYPKEPILIVIATVFTLKTSLSF